MWDFWQLVLVYLDFFICFLLNRYWDERLFQKKREVIEEDTQVIVPVVPIRPSPQRKKRA